MKFTVGYPIVLAGYDPVLITPQAGFMQRPGSAEEHRDHLGQLADAGVDSFVVRPPAPLAGSVEPG